MSPAWPRILAASTSLMPKTLVSVVPLAITAAAQRVRFSTRARSIRRRSATSARAIALRSRSTTAAGRIRPRSLAAASADSSVGAPPGCRSRSRRWSRLTTVRRSWASSSRRSERSRSTALWSSGPTRRRSGWLWATLATLAASMPSVLRPWPRASRRARAASVAGTSSTVSSRATSCCARRWPRPVAPSTAQIRSGQRSAQRRSRSSMALVAGSRSSPRMRPLGSSATAVCDDLWGSMPMVITWCLLEWRGRWSTAAGNLSSGERLTPLSSHADGGRWPAGTL